MGLGVRTKTVGQETPYRLQPWYSAYVSALFEFDPALLAPRIRLAEILINSRKRELCNSRTAFPELSALNQAQSALRVLLLRREINASEWGSATGAKLELRKVERLM